ncbi:MAG: hypothetical protein QF920_08245, partial [Verrucomicrobiota bacterium]|nr:hypothetical protein [Verrucomicrobiota bacterium]
SECALRLAKRGDSVGGHMFRLIRTSVFVVVFLGTLALGQAADWGEVGSGTAKEGDRYVVRVRPSAAQQFFRLHSE